MYDDAQREIDLLMEKMSNTYELPPLDMIGWGKNYAQSILSTGFRDWTRFNSGFNKWTT
jgi:hypothetical protein